MAKTYAYLRVSTLEQNTEKNKVDILKFANAKKLGTVEFIEETITGKANFRDRKLGELLKTLNEGDTIITPELSRLARSTSQILEIIDITKQKGIHPYSLKENFSNDESSITSTVTSTIFALVAQIERELISLRTKEALASKKADGVKLGRPKGKGKSKLDKDKEEILKLLSYGVPKSTIAKTYNVTTASLYNWLKYIN